MFQSFHIFAHPINFAHFADSALFKLVDQRDAPVVTFLHVYIPQHLNDTAIECSEHCQFSSFSAQTSIVGVLWTVVDS